MQIGLAVQHLLDQGHGESQPLRQDRDRRPLPSFGARHLRSGDCTTIPTKQTVVAHGRERQS
ncbi:MAG: hypothetical protein MZW92_71725 [Comamonadaceae bacterium]|nr:hypothetical protein [Comamonadaceae bacterium]